MCLFDGKLFIRVQILANYQSTLAVIFKVNLGSIWLKSPAIATG